MQTDTADASNSQQNYKNGEARTKVTKRQSIVIVGVIN